MKIAKAMLGGLALVAVPFLAHSEDMSYRYFQLGYIETNPDGTSESADGFATRGSFGFADNFFVFTELARQEVSSINTDINTMAIGLGAHYPLSDNLDLVGRVGWANIEADVSGLGEADEDGFLAGAGIRAQAGDKIEVEAGVIHTDYGDLGSDTGAEIALRYNFSKRWAAALEYQDVGDLSTFFAGVRINFGVK